MPSEEPSQTQPPSETTEGPFGCLDLPFSGAHLTGQVLRVEGWALSSSSIEKIEVLLDGKVVADAAYGLPRADVALDYPETPDSFRSGFRGRAAASALPEGTATVWIRATDATGCSGEFGYRDIEIEHRPAGPKREEPVISHPYQKTWVELENGSLPQIRAKLVFGIDDQQQHRELAERYLALVEAIGFTVNRTEIVIEIGPGLGRLSEACVEKWRPSRLIGIDISRDLLSRAARLVESVDFVAYDGLQLPLTESSVHKAISHAVFWHIEKHCAFGLLRDIERVLKPGGELLIDFLNFHDPANQTGWADNTVPNIVMGNSSFHWIEPYSLDELRIIAEDILKLKVLRLEPAPVPGVTTGDGMPIILLHARKA